MSAGNDRAHSAVFAFVSVEIPKDLSFIPRLPPLKSSAATKSIVVALESGQASEAMDAQVRPLPLSVSAVSSSPY